MGLEYAFRCPKCSKKLDHVIGREEDPPVNRQVSCPHCKGTLDIEKAHAAASERVVKQAQDQLNRGIQEINRRSRK